MKTTPLLVVALLALPPAAPLGAQDSSSLKQDYSKFSTDDAAVRQHAATFRIQLTPEIAKLSAKAKEGAAEAEFKDGVLTVRTGEIERVFAFTGKGLVTTRLADSKSGRNWAKAPKVACDWDFNGITNDMDATLVGVEARVDDDDGFSCRHVEVVTTLRYEKAKLEVQHVVWAFPGVPGVRTQLRVKALAGFKPGAVPSDHTINSSGGTVWRPGIRTDHLPLDFSVKNARTYWGMFNDPGNRLDQSKPMLQEQRISGWPVFQDESILWASGEAVDFGGAGVAVIKESHKTVNNQGHQTGGFFSGPDGLSVTGWGLTPQEFATDRFRECWATWTIAYQDGNDGLQLALKRFNLARYPVFPKRDALLIANTWGPGAPDGGVFSNEAHCLKEIPILADLGVQVLQIDAGWHSYAWWGDTNFGKLDKGRFPHGFKATKDACDKNNLKLGLWFHARNAKEEDLAKTTGELHVASWKLDFEHIGSRADLENRFAQLRRMMKADWMKTQFTLCPEYEDPRFGWYFAQEYGSIYFQNNQEALPVHLTAVPYQVLRQHWLMAKYFALNKLQVMMQNPKREAASRSDGPLHGHGYAFATGLACGAPVFFQSGQFLDMEGRKELKQLFAAYNPAHEDMITSIVFPIGDEPDNASWTGFQLSSTAKENSGHLLVFRELHNEQKTAKLRLKFLAGKTLALTNLLTQEKSEAQVDPDGQLSFDIEKPADYRFLRYEVK